MLEANKHPKARAEEYKAAQQPPQETPPASPIQDAQQAAPRVRRTPEQWQDFVSQRIEEALKEGAFDNLRNKGKPLNAAPDPHTPPEMQMANSLLKNNDLVPAWISDRKAVLAAIDRFREKMTVICAEYREEVGKAATPQRRAQLEKLWQAQLEKWRAEVVELNRRIQTQNLMQPVTFLEIFKLRLDDELRRSNAPLEGEWKN